MKKVVMLSQFPIENDSRICKEAESLGKKGYDVTVLSVNYNRLANEDVREYFKIARIDLLTLRLFKQGSMWFPKVIEYMFRASWAAYNLDAAVYHAHDVEALPPMYVASKLRGKPLIYDSHELHCERGNNSIRKIINYWIERLILPSVDQVIVAFGQTGMDYLLKTRWSGRLKKEIVDIGNYPSHEDITGRCEDIRKRLSLPKDCFVIVYVGFCRKIRGLERVIPILKSNNKVYFVILGVFEGNYKVELSEIAALEGVRERTVICDMVDPSEVVSTVYGADMGVALIDKSPLSYYFSRPTKILEYMMAGFPVLASDFPEMRKVLVREDGNHAGWCVDQEDQNMINKTFKEIYTNNQERKKRGENARKLAEKNFNWENEEKKLLKIYDKLSERGNKLPPPI